MKTVICVGDEFQVDFIKNQNGGKPICRVEGMVCFLDRAEKTFVAPCSSWIVRIKEINDRFCVVTPLVKTHTAKERIVDFHEKIESLRPVKKDKQKPVKGYMYKSFAELRLN